MSTTVKSAGAAEKETARDLCMPKIDEGRLAYILSVLFQSEREISGPAHRYKDAAWFALMKGAGFSCLSSSSIPLSMEEALQHPERDHWVDSIRSEMQSIIQLNTFKLEDLPLGRSLVSCKWVFDLKQKSEREVVRYKALLVARGLSQVHGTDYFEVYSPVVRYETFRLLMGMEGANRARGY